MQRCTLRNATALCLILASPAVRSLSGGEGAMRMAEFPQRRETALHNIAERKVRWSVENDLKLAHFVAQAKFAMGRDQEAQVIINGVLAQKPMVEYFDPEFPLWSVMDCYLRWKDQPGKYTTPLREKTRDYVAAAQQPSTATTYNHHWMLAAGLMLAYQEWGDDVVRYQYSAQDPTGRKWVEQQFDQIVRRSYPELLTDTYSRFNLGAILSLYNFYDDPVIKNKARMVLDWIFLQQAAYFFKGHAAGSTRRTYFPLQRPDNALSPNWLYFGGPIESGGELAVVNAGFALSEYRPPALFGEIAWERGNTYVQTGSRCQKLTERMTTFFDQSYVVFSQYEARNDLGKRSTWHHEFLKAGVRWETPFSQYSTLFIKHSCPKELSNIGMPWLGDTEFHQVLQHRGTLIGVCNIPAQRPPAYREESWCNDLLGVCAGNYRAIIDDTAQGRLYLHYHTVMIGVHLTAPIRLQPSSWPFMRGRAQEFRLAGNASGLQAGYVIATARPDPKSADPARELARFREQLQPRFEAAEFSTIDQMPYLRYRDATDTTLELVFRPKGTSSIRKINGRNIPSIDDDSQWPLLHNPWVEQAVDGDQLHIHCNGTHMIYDFARWKTARWKTAVVSE